MRRLLFSILILLALAAPAWPTTYYVSPSGSNTSPYDTWAKAATAPATVISLNPSGGPHTVYVNGVFYAVSLTSIGANWAGSTMQGVSAAGVAASCSGSACNAYPAGVDEVILSGAYTPSGITWTQVSGNVYLSGNGSMTTQPNSAIYTVSGTTTHCTQDATCSSSTCSPALNHYCYDTTNHGSCANVGQIPSTGILEAAKSSYMIYAHYAMTFNNFTLRVGNTYAAYVDVAATAWNSVRFNYGYQYGLYAYNFSGSAGTPSITVNGGAANYNVLYNGYYIRTVTYASLSNISATGNTDQGLYVDAASPNGTLSGGTFNNNNPTGASGGPSEEIYRAADGCSHIERDRLQQRWCATAMWIFGNDNVIAGSTTK